MGRVVRQDSRELVRQSDELERQERLPLHSEVLQHLECEIHQFSLLTLQSRFAPLLRKRASLSDPSRVVVTASVAGIGIGSLGENATFAYSASKAAALHITRNLAVELAPQGILCNAIAPGFFPTKMANGLMELSGGTQQLAEATPNKRLGTPEDIAAAVVYLCSRAGGHITGGHVVLDGGNVLARGKL